MRTFRLLILLPLLLLSWGFKRQATQQKVTLVMPYAAKASVVIKDSSSPPVLVRTLFSGVQLSAGPHDFVWDGNDDKGNPAIGRGPFQAQSLINNVTVTWDGPVFSSQDYQTGFLHMRGIGGIVDMVCEGSTLFGLRGYNERDVIVSQASTTKPNTWSQSGATSMPRSVYDNLDGNSICSDGMYVYVGASGNPAVARGLTQSVILAYKVSDSEPLVWSSVAPTAGVSRPGDNNKGQWLIVDKYFGGTTAHAPTSLACQRAGSVLAVAEYNLGLVKFVDKRSGADAGRLADLSQSGVTCVRWSKDETTLWVSADSTVYGYTNDGTNWKIKQTINGPGSEVRSMAVNKNNGNLAILYGGKEQRVHVYDPTGSTDLAQIGTVDAYAPGSSPAVADIKFMIGPNAPSMVAVGCGLAFQDNGELWVVSDRECRCLRFPSPASSPKAADARIQWNGGGGPSGGYYQLCMDPNTPSRVIVNGGLEFTRNWSVPLAPGMNSSWSYTNNWLYGMSTASGEGIGQVLTGPNGRVYAKVVTPRLTSKLVELTSTGVRVVDDSFGRAWLGSDFSVWNYPLVSGTEAFRTVQLSVAPLSGFDGAGNPTFRRARSFFGGRGIPAVVGVSPFVNGGLSPSGGPPFPTVRTGGVTYLVTHSNQAAPGRFPGQYYLGLAAEGASSYTVQTALAQLNQIPIVRNGRPSITLRENYPSGWAWSAGDFISFGNNGEAWNESQSNQIMLYHDSGLFVTQFGTPSMDVSYKNGLSAGNSGGGNFYGSGMVLLPDGTIRIIHNTEGSHLSAVEWQISNLSSVVVTGPVGFRDGTATLTVSGAGRSAGSAIEEPEPAFSDHFDRPSNSKPGSGWVSPGSAAPLFKVANNLLQATGAGYHASPLQPGAVILRPSLYLDTIQTISIPQQLWDPSKVYRQNATHQAQWGVVSRWQSSGAAVGCTLSFAAFERNGVQAGNGTLNLGIGLYNPEGVFYLMTVDAAPFLPDSPGHAYKLTFTTKADVASGRTYLHAVVLDATTGAVLFDRDTVTDDPSIQSAGRTGIVGNIAQSAISGYSLSLLPR